MTMKKSLNFKSLTKYVGHQDDLSFVWELIKCLTYLFIEKHNSYIHYNTYTYSERRNASLSLTTNILN